MGATRAVLVAEGFDVVAELTERSGGGAPGEAGADHQDLVFTLISGIDQFQFETVTIPRSLNRSSRTFAVEYHDYSP